MAYTYDNIWNEVIPFLTKWGRWATDIEFRNKFVGDGELSYVRKLSKTHYFFIRHHLEVILLFYNFTIYDNFLKFLSDCAHA